MAVSWIPVAKYSAVVFSSSCLGAGTCFAIHGKPEQKQVQQVQITEVVEQKLTSKLKKNIQDQTSGCVAKENDRVSKIRQPSLYFDVWKKNDTPNYKDCLNAVSLDDVFQQLFDEGKEELFPDSEN